jgi:hypothetical protein
MRTDRSAREASDKPILLKVSGGQALKGIERCANEHPDRVRRDVLDKVESIIDDRKDWTTPRVASQGSGGNLERMF